MIFPPLLYPKPICPHRVAVILDLELALDACRASSTEANAANKALKQRVLMLEASVEQQSYAMQEIFTQVCTVGARERGASEAFATLRPQLILQRCNQAVCGV